MEDTNASKAIQCALEQKWPEAIRLNLELVKQNVFDVEALNRLAYAYLKSGDPSLSKTTYQKVLKIDKHNPIAIKILKWLSGVTKKDVHTNGTHVVPAPTVFLEEPGKTKIVTLVHTAPAKILCNLTTAQKVKLIPKKHSIEVRDDDNDYVGALPDDLAYKLLKFIASGNSYAVYIKGVGQNAVSVFMRELKRGKKYAHIPSFPMVVTGQSSTRPNSTEADADTEETEEEETTS